MRIDHIIDYHARQRPDNLALSQIDAPQEQTLSYSEMNAKAQRRRENPQKNMGIVKRCPCFS
jgi:acyl-CoA synthetase (AMP-forming)/AMP-acid ligase II